MDSRLPDELRRYFKRFLKWALRLPLEDAKQLASFMQAVQAAHTEGQKRVAEGGAAGTSEQPGRPTPPADETTDTEGEGNGAADRPESP